MKQELIAEKEAEIQRLQAEVEALRGQKHRVFEISGELVVNVSWLVVSSEYEEILNEMAEDLVSEFAIREGFFFDHLNDVTAKLTEYDYDTAPEDLYDLDEGGWV